MPIVRSFEQRVLTGLRRMSLGSLGGTVENAGPAPRPIADLRIHAPRGGGAPTIFIAASDASQHSKDKADMVCAGAGDESVLSDAFSELGPTGGRILLSEGGFHIDAAAVDSGGATGITLEGMSHGSTFLIAGAGMTGLTLLDISGGYDMRVAHLGLLGRTFVTFGLNFAANEGEVEDVFVYQASFGIYIASGTSANHVARCVASNCDWGIDHAGRGSVVGCSAVVCTSYGIVGNLGAPIVGCTATNNDGIGFESSGMIEACDSESNAAGGIHASSDGQIIGCRSYLDATSSGYGLWATQGSANISNGATIANSRVLACQGAASIFTSVPRSSITANRVAYQTTVRPPGHGIALSGASDSAVLSNLITADTGAPGATTDGINIDANTDRANVQGNTIRGITNWRDAIRVANANCDDNLVTNNDYKGLTFTDSGTGTITAAGNRP